LGLLNQENICETLAHLGEAKGTDRILFGKAEGKRQVGYPWLIWKDNSEVYLQKII